MITPTESHGPNVERRQMIDFFPEIEIHPYEWKKR